MQFSLVPGPHRTSMSLFLSGALMQLRKFFNKNLANPYFQIKSSKNVKINVKLGYSGKYAHTPLMDDIGNPVVNSR